jgi:hypothetical protein
MTDISKNINALQPSATYTVQVRAKNSDNEFSEWSNAYTFSTPSALLNTVNSTVQTTLSGGSVVAGDIVNGPAILISGDGISGISAIGGTTFNIPTDPAQTPTIAGFQIAQTGLIGVGQIVASASSTTAAATASAKVPLASASSITPGMYVYGTPFKPSTTVRSANSKTGIIILSQAASVAYPSGVTASFVPNANLQVGTSSANNITIRGQDVPGNPGAIYSIINSVNTTATTGSGFYVDEIGRFRLAGANGVVSMDGSGNLAVSGSISATSGSIGGFSIALDKLSSSFSTSSYVAVSGSGDYAFWAGNPTASLAPFWIKMDGTSKVTGVQVGNVGGFTITSSALWGGTSPNIVGLDPSNATYSIFSGATASSGTGAKFWVTTSGSVYGTAASFQSPILSGGTLSGTSTNSGSLVGGAIVVPATNPKFTVDSSGNLTATNAYISGSVYANSGSFTGAVYASVGSFTGSVTASSGSIGAFNITQTALYSGGSGSVVGLDPTNATYSFFAGATASTGAGSKFWVTNSGSVYGTAASFVGPVFSGTVNLQNAVLYQGATGSISGGALAIPATSPKFTVDSLGNVVAQSASITGFISASSGSVGGWSINTGSLTSGTGASAVGISTGNYAFYAGNVTASSAPFSVTNTGILTASGANISGSLTATTGSIGGFTITGSALYGGTSGSITGFNPYNASATIFAGATSSAGDNAKFYVTNSGSIYSTGGASFTGPVMSAALLSAPVISGSTTNSGSIIGGSIFVPNTTTPAFKVDSSGNLIATSASITGTISSSAGNIGGIYLNSDSISAASSSNYATQILNTGPQIFLQYESSPLTDSSSNNYPVSLGGAGNLYSTAGFNGTGRSVYSASGIQVTSQIVNSSYAGASSNVSIEFWVNGAVATTSYSAFAGKTEYTRGWYIQTTGAPSNSLQLIIYTDALSNQSAGVIPVLDNKWHHVIYQIGSGTASSFIDGQYFGSATYNAGTTNISSSGTFFVNHWVNSGVKDQFAVYHRLLSSAEILANYNAGIAARGFSIYNNGQVNINNANVAGNINATSGSIGSWSITSGNLVSGTGASAVGLTTGTYAIYAGNPTASLAPFSVTNTGILTASNANISGSISAISGSIGGFAIINNSLSATGVVLSSSSGLNLGTNQFTVSQTGAMVAQTASITGQITAQSGSFTGNVYIQSPGRLIAQSGTNSVILTSTGLTGNQSGIPVFTLPTDGSPPTIGQFKIVQTGLSAVGLVTITASTTSGSSTALVTASNASSLWAGMSAYGGGFASATVITSVNQSTGAIGLSVAASATNAGFTASMIPNANMVIGTTASNNITIRGQNSPGQVGAIFSVISGSNTVPGSASGFYVDQAGAFWLGSGAGNYLSASNGNLSVSGSIVATSGSFSGAINASAGTFTGSVGALTGSIGGWSISSSALTSSNVGLYAPNSPAVSEIAIFAGSAIANRSTAPFRIDYSGNMTASNANISGSINANSGSIAGWNITSGSLIATGASISGTGGLAFGSPAKFTVDTSGNLTAQNISASGSIAASAGSVGGWAISSSALTSASVGFYAPVSPSATEIAIFAGSALGSRNTAPFRVDYSGNLTASNANISGSIIANSGSIANWTISTGSLTSGTGASAVGITTGSYAFYAGSATASSAPFSVTNTGNLVASNSNISGSISASAGRIGLGSSTTWYIGTDYDGQGVIKNYPLSASTPAYVSPGAYGGYSANYSASYNDYIVGYFPTSIEIDSSPYIHLQPAYNGPSAAVDPRQGLILDPNGNGSYGVLDINGNVRYDTVLWWGYGDIRDSQLASAPFYITSGGNMFASSAYISNLTTINSSVSTITASSINSNIINSGQVNADNINATNMSLGIIQGQGAAFAFSVTPLSAQSDGLGYVTYTVKTDSSNIGFYEYGVAIGETILISGMQNSTVKNADIYNGKFTIVKQNFSDANQTFAVYNPAAIGVYEYLSPNPAAYGVVDNATVIADSTGNMEIGPQYQVPISYDGTIPRGLSEGDIYYDIKKLAPYPSFYEIINDATNAGSAARNITNSGAPYLPVKGISNMQVNVPTDGVLEVTFGGNLYWLGAASTLSITSYIAASVVPTVFSMIDLAPNGSNGIIFTTNYNNINGDIGSKTIIQTSSSPFYYNSVNTSSITLTSVTQGTPTTASIIPIGNLFTSSAVVATNANNGNNTIVDGMWIKALPTSGTGFSGSIQNITTGNFVTGSISISATSASTTTPSAYFVSSGTVTGNDVTSGMLVQDANAKSYQVYNVTTDTNNNVIGLILSSSTNATALVSASIYNAIAISSSIVTASIHSASINNLGYVTSVDDNGNAAYISGTGSISASTAYSLGPSNSSNSPFMQLTLPGTGYNAPYGSIGPVTKVWPLVNVPSGGVTLDFAYWAKLGSPNSASPNMQYSSWIFKYFPYAAHSYFTAASVV